MVELLPDQPNWTPGYKARTLFSPRVMVVLLTVLYPSVVTVSFPFTFMVAGLLLVPLQVRSPMVTSAPFATVSVLPLDSVIRSAVRLQPRVPVLETEI